MKPPTVSPATSLPPAHACLHVFLGFCTVCIFTALMLPQTFGFQDFRQWAGMYVDNWCQIYAYSAPPGTPGVKSEWGAVGRMGTTEAVWTAPSHNQLSCAHWAKEIVCGRPVSGGWIATDVRPFFKQEKFYLGDANICDYEFPSPLPWFSL